MAKDIKEVVLLGRRLLLLHEFREVSGLVLCGKLPREECRVVKAGVKCKEIVEGANVLCVGAPLFGDKQKNMLQDIAILTGGTFISKDASMPLNKADLEHLGKASKGIANGTTTTIVGGCGDVAEINKRVNTIKKQLKETESEFEKAKLTERLAKLTAGVAVIRVGGHTEIEMK